MGAIYASTGDPRIVVSADPDGVGIVANRDGLRSLGTLLLALAEGTAEADHIHLTPTMQLPRSSEPIVVALKPADQLPAISD